MFWKLRKKRDSKQLKSEFCELGVFRAPHERIFFNWGEGIKVRLQLTKENVEKIEAVNMGFFEKYFNLKSF